MSAPSLQIQYQGVSQVSADAYNTYIQGCNIVTNLRDFVGISGLKVFLGGYTSIGDGGQGFFYWNASGVAPDDGGVTTIVPNGAASGEWSRITDIAVLASIANNRVLANISGVSASPTATTLTALIDSAIGSVQGDILYRGASSWAVLAPGTSGQVLKTNGAAANPSWGTNASVILQQVRTETGAVATGTTTIPYDDTIPQNTEGDQYMTLSITPTSATSKLVIQAIGNFTNSATVNMTMALFQDATAGALAAVPFSLFGGAFVAQMALTHQMTSGTTSATAFKIRVGGGSAGTTTFNGSAGSRLYGGVAASSIIITEYSA